MGSGAAQLRDIATNHSEFDFTCGTFPFADGHSNYNDKDIFGNECSITQMVFPAGEPQMRFAVLYPGGIAFSSDAGNSWIPLNATNAQDSLRPIEMPQSAFYDPTVNSVGESSSYVALEGKGVKRIDAPFATMTSVPGCTSALSCSGITFGFPSLEVSCPSAVNFYQFANTPNQKLVWHVVPELHSPHPQRCECGGGLCGTNEHSHWILRQLALVHYLIS